MPNVLAKELASPNVRSRSLELKPGVMIATHNSIIETDLITSDLSSRVVFDQPGDSRVSSWPNGVLRVEDKLGDCDIVWDVRETCCR